MTELLKLKYFYVIFLLFIVITLVSSNIISADQKIKITADEIQVKQSDQSIKAVGNAVAIDEKGTKIKSDFITYDKSKSLIRADGNILLNDVDNNTYFFSKLETSENFEDIKGKNVKARMDDGSRIVGSSFIKKK